MGMHSSRGVVVLEPSVHDACCPNASQQGGPFFCAPLSNGALCADSLCPAPLGTRQSEPALRWCVTLALRLCPRDRQHLRTLPSPPLNRLEGGSTPNGLGVFPLIDEACRLPRATYQVGAVRFGPGSARGTARRWPPAKGEPARCAAHALAAPAGSNTGLGPHAAHAVGWAAALCGAQASAACVCCGALRRGGGLLDGAPHGQEQGVFRRPSALQTQPSRPRLPAASAWWAALGAPGWAVLDVSAAASPTHNRLLLLVYAPATPAAPPQDFVVAEHAHLLGSSSVTIIRELFAADAAAAATGGAAADSLTSSAATELPSPKKTDPRVRCACCLRVPDPGAAVWPFSRSDCKGVDAHALRPQLNSCSWQPLVGALQLVPRRRAVRALSCCPVWAHDSAASWRG